MFIPVAAVYPDAVDMLPKCLNDTVKCGIKRENIFVYDMHEELKDSIGKNYDVVYLCGGSPEYLLKRINEGSFRDKLLEFISDGGIVVGVSAGSIVFSDDLPHSLGLLRCKLDVHCPDETREKTGVYPIDRTNRIFLGERQAITFSKDCLTIFE